MLLHGNMKNETDTDTETENTIYYLSKDDSGNIPVCTGITLYR